MYKSARNPITIRQLPLRLEKRMTATLKIIKDIIPPATIPISAPAKMYFSVKPQAYHIPDESIPPAMAPKAQTDHRINGIEMIPSSPIPTRPPMS
jgi:hypothetical protein